MGRVAAIGEEVAIAGYGLAGAVVLPAEGADAVRGRWSGLDDDVEVVILTTLAAEALGEQRLDARAPLSVVVPP